MSRTRNDKQAKARRRLQALEQVEARIARKGDSKRASNYSKEEKQKRLAQAEKELAALQRPEYRYQKGLM